MEIQMKRNWQVACVSLVALMHVDYASAKGHGDDLKGASGSEEVEVEKSVEGFSPPDISLFAQDSTGQVQAQAAACNRWWINGSHKYKWKYYIFAGYNSLSGSSTTTYADTNGSCGVPLIVDSLSVKGNTLNIHSWPAIIDKTAYNVSYVEDSDKTTWVGSGNHACGAVVTHTAIKNGVTWSVVSRSGCGR